MPADDLSGRQRLDVAFGLLLASGVSVGAVCVLAIGDWVKPQGEAAFGLYILAILTLVPTVLAWLAGSLQAFMAPRDRDARLGAVLTTGHLGWWAVVVSLGTWLDQPLPGWIMGIGMVETGVYGVGATYLAVRWLGGRRRHSAGQVAA
jgi:hypothetical protein